MIDANATDPSLVVLTDSLLPRLDGDRRWSPGVDPASRLPAAGVSIGPGQHTIVMRVPAHQLDGSAGSSACSALLAMLGACVRRDRDSAAGAGGDDARERRRLHAATAAGPAPGEAIAVRGVRPVAVISRAGAPAPSAAFRGRSPAPRRLRAGRPALSLPLSPLQAHLADRARRRGSGGAGAGRPTRRRAGAGDRQRAGRTTAPRPHVVVDKYEHGPGRRSTATCSSSADLGRFDLIVAISTLEHVGWDEEPARSGKGGSGPSQVLRSRLAPGGLLVDHRAGRLQPGLRRRAAMRCGRRWHRADRAAPQPAGTRWRRGRAGRGVVGAVRLPALSGPRRAVRRSSRAGG